MKIHKIKQKTPEWFNLKKRFPFSASNAQAISSYGAGLDTLIDEVMVERFSTEVIDNISSPDIRRGNELEDDARQIYELETGNKIEEVGFITNELISDLAGVSPDGVIDADGLAEIKCLKGTVYIKKLYEYFEKGYFKIDSAHEWQLQMQLLISDRDWVDYIIYNPNFKKSIVIQRVYKDPLAQQKLRTGIKVAENKFKIKEALLINNLTDYATSC
jgi:hypothetical protein